MKSKLPNTKTTIFTIMSKLANEHDAINLAQGFPDFDCDPVLKDMVNHYLQAGKNQYAPMPGLPALREVLANKINRSYDVDISSEEITMTVGATQAVSTTILAFVGMGDEVIVFDPAFDIYKPAIQLVGGLVVPYALTKPDYAIDWSAVESLITDKTKMIIINSPHNPTGSVLQREDLTRLEKIVKDKDIIVLSDEVYEHITFDDYQHVSVLEFSELYQKSVCTFSLGKTLHTTGWRMGYTVAPLHLTHEIRKVHQFSVFSITTFLQYAVADYLQEPSTYEGLPILFQEKRDFLQKKLTQSRLNPLPSYGTYFQLYDYSAISDMDDVAFAKWLTIEKGVATIPISVFYEDQRQEQTVRLCFAKEQSTLEEAAARLIKI